MKKVLFVCALLVALSLGFASPAVAAPRNISEAAKLCQDSYASLGFREVGGCVSFFARGGQLPAPGPARLTLTFDTTTTCSDGNTPTYGCVWSVAGSGLKPGSVVTVGGADVAYGATIPVGPSGSVSANGIYHQGSCVNPGYETVDFIARGTKADGTPIESAVVTGDYRDITTLCPA